MDSSTTQKELTVLVTGFAPFKEQYPCNPSWEIASRLPSYLPTVPQRSEGDAEQQSLRPPVDLPPIRILVHPRPIRVAYKTVRRLVPRLWERSIWEAGGAEGRERRAGEEDSVDESDDDSSIDGEQQQEQQDGKEADEDAKAGDPGEAGGKDGDDDDDWVEVDGEQIPKDDQAMQEALAAALQETLALEKQYRRREREEKQRRRKRVRQGSYAKIDLAIHIGMAGPGKYYCLERRGHRDDYKLRDVDGELLGDEERREREGDRWIWAGLPREIETDLDVEDVLERWIRYTSNKCDLRISENAGHYLCDFIYYSSLAYLTSRGRPRKVVFLHVPSDAGDEAIETGRELVLQLIRSMVESELLAAGKCKAQDNGGAKAS